MKRIALYPGTFDPVTNGHLDIIYRASSLCDVLIIGVAENIGKNPFFKISQRKSLIQDAINQNLKDKHQEIGKRNSSLIFTHHTKKIPYQKTCSNTYI